MIKIPKTDAGVFVPHERFLALQKDAQRKAAEKRKQKKAKQQKNKAKPATTLKDKKMLSLLKQNKGR